MTQQFLCIGLLGLWLESHIVIQCSMLAHWCQSKCYFPISIWTLKDCTEINLWWEHAYVRCMMYTCWMWYAWLIMAYMFAAGTGLSALWLLIKSENNSKLFGVRQWFPNLTTWPKFSHYPVTKQICATCQMATDPHSTSA